MKSFFDIFSDAYKCIIVALTCTVVCIVGNYRNFGYVKFGSFELSFDFLFFVSLVLAIVCWTILAIACIQYGWFLINGKILLNRLKKCTAQEKRFLYNRIFEKDNTRSIDFKEDSYFYQYVGYNNWVPYRDDLLTKEKVLIFLRKLENKKILQSDGRQTMNIPQQVWDILIKNSDEIFRGLNEDAK